jgi:hypothetical protein
MPVNDLYKSLAVGYGTTLSVIAIVFYVLLVIAEWKIFTKAGEHGWACLIPIYNVYVMFRVIYGSGLKFLLLLVPVLNIVVGIAMWIRLAQAFGKGMGFAILTLFFPNICTLILGFGSDEYEGPIRSFI